MSITRRAAVTAAIVAVFGACGESVSPPTALTDSDRAQLAKRTDGTGLVLDNLTGVSVPIIGEIGTVDIDQAIITELTVVELAGNIVGVNATGVLQLSGGALGSDIVTQDFTTQLLVASSGNGQCDVLSVDLGPVAVDALGEAVFIEVPAASVTPSASGALGPLLCNLGQLLDAPIGQITSGVRGLVNAINRILI